MTEMWRYKYPMEYEVTPEVIDKGNNWVTLKLRNIGSETLKDLDIQLHSQDTYNLSVYGTGTLGGLALYISNMEPNKEKELVFRVNALGPADVYATIKGRKDGEYFWWESGWTRIKLSEDKAEIGRLLVLSSPYTTIEKTISVEATIMGWQESTELKLEFWAETPSRKFEWLAKIDLKDLPIREEARYSAEFTPKETGYYTIYAYLYDGWQRIGVKTETIYARKQ